MAGVYLSFNQGWTQYRQKFGAKQGREEIENTASGIRSLLSTPLNDFPEVTIDLASAEELPTGYVRGHIMGKYYPLSCLPSDSVIIDDLRNMIAVYREAKGKLGASVFNIDSYGDLLAEDLTGIHLDEVSKRLEEEVVSKDNLLEIVNAMERELADKPIIEQQRTVRALVRNQKIVQLVKEIANYRCEICGELGFEKKNGSRYCEAHHVLELSQSRLDLPSNLLCVCALCHRVLHYGSQDALKERLGKRHEKGEEAEKLSTQIPMGD
jgi:5-methylcytosine-specific restriction protein A